MERAPGVAPGARPDVWKFAAPSAIGGHKTSPTTTAIEQAFLEGQIDGETLRIAHEWLDSNLALEH